MTKVLSFTRFAFVVSLLSFASNLSYAQTLDYEKAMDEIWDNYLSDYPEPTIKALDQLFTGVNVDELPAKTKFLYYYFYGICFMEISPDDAVTHLTQARKIASSNREVGIRNAIALTAEKYLADLALAEGTEEAIAEALLLYNDVIVVGISLLNNPDIGRLVVMSMIEEAKMGVKLWEDPEWVKKMWLKARDIALEVNDGGVYTYYVLNVCHYYCDLGEYDIALSFIEDAKNKNNDLLQIDVSKKCKYILDAKELLSRNEDIRKTKGEHSLEYWSNKLDIATLSTVLCSNDKAFQWLKEVEQGFVMNKLTETYEYAQVLFFLVENTIKHPEIAESYLEKQIEILNTTPQFFIYTTDIETYNSLALCQMKQGKYAKAQKNYNEALSCLERVTSYSDQPGYKRLMATILHNIGRNLYYLGEYKESVDFFTKSIALQEDVDGEVVMPKTKIYLAESLEHINEH